MTYQQNYFQNESFGISDSKQTVIRSTPLSVELAEYARTQSISISLALDCENSEDSPCEQGEYVDDVEYETPDLSGGVEGIDYGIVYGLIDEEMAMEVEA